MNVLMLTTVFPPEVRSAALLMGELAESLAQRGHRVTVITAASAGAARPRKRSLFGVFAEDLCGVRVIRIPNFAIHRTHAPAILRGLGQMLNAFAFLLAALFVKDVDVTLAYSPPLALGIVGAVLHHLRRIPHVLNVQDLVPQYAIDLGILKNRSLIRLLKEIERTVYRHVQVLIRHPRGDARDNARRGLGSPKGARGPQTGAPLVHAHSGPARPRPDTW